MNACVRTNPLLLDIFSVKRRLNEAFQQLECRSEQDAKAAVVKEFGKDMASYIQNEYPELYQAFVDMVLHQAYWVKAVAIHPTLYKL